MTDSELLKRTWQSLEAFRAKPPAERFLDMQRSGLINADGELQKWDASLVIVATNATDSRRATYFLCRIPVLGRPGGAEIEIRRESIMEDLKSGKRIITATIDDQSGAIREGEEVRLTRQGFLRTDANEIQEDNLSELPRFRRSCVS